MKKQKYIELMAEITFLKQTILYINEKLIKLERKIVREQYPIEKNTTIKKEMTKI